MAEQSAASKIEAADRFIEPGTDSVSGDQPAPF